MAFQQGRVVRRDLLDRLPECFHLVVAVVGEIFNAREQHHRRGVFDDERVLVHSCRAAVADDASDASIAAVVHGGIQAAFVNEALGVEIVLNVAGFGTFGCSPRGTISPTRPGSHAPLGGLLQRDSDIHRLTGRGGEPLHDDVVRPGGEGLTNPVAALVAPMHLRFAVLEIDGAKIVLGRSGFRKIKLHQECRNGAVRFGILLDGTFIHALECKRSGFAVFSVQHHLPHLRKNVRDLRRLQGPLPRHEQAFVVEKDLLRVRIAHQLDIHGSIAGGESSR